jgi:hypothetical protein
VTNFESKCAILADLWINWKNDGALEDFVEYNDLGLPMAYLIHTELVTPNEEAFPYIGETFDLLVESLGLDPDQEYFSFNEMIEKTED